MMTSFTVLLSGLHNFEGWLFFFFFIFFWKKSCKLQTSFLMSVQNSGCSICNTSHETVLLLLEAVFKN